MARPKQGENLVMVGGAVLPSTREDLIEICRKEQSRRKLPPNTREVTVSKIVARAVEAYVEYWKETQKESEEAQAESDRLAVVGSAAAGLHRKRTGLYAMAART